MGNIHQPEGTAARPRTRSRRAELALALSAGLAIIATAAPADALAPVLGYSGRLFDASGLPVTGELAMTFRLYNQATGGDLLFEEAFADQDLVWVEEGYFWQLLANNQVGTLSLDEIAALYDGLYLELEVEGSLLEPRQPLAPVPWALSAGVGGGAPGGGPGGDRDTLGSLACADGQVPKRIAGVWACSDDLVAAGTGGASGTDTLAQLSCAANQVAKWDGTAWICSADMLGSLSEADVALSGHNHDGTYAPAAHDHDGVYAPVSHSHDGTYALIGHHHDGTYAPIAHNHDGTYAPVAHNHDTRYYQQSVLNSAGTVNDPSNPVDWTKLKGVPATLVDGDDDTTYAAGTGITISGTTISTDSSVVPSKTGTTSQCFDGSTLCIDYPNNRVGVGTSAPGSTLDVLGTADITGTARATSFAYRSTQTRYYVVGPDEFMPRNSQLPAYWGLHGDQEYGHFVNITGSWRAFATLHLPQGAVVTEVRIYYVDTSASNLTLYFRRTTLSTGSATNVGSVTSTETDGTPVLRNRAFTLNETINNGSYRYSLIFESSVGSNAHRLYNVRIRYTVTQAGQ